MGIISFIKNRTTIVKDKELEREKLRLNWDSFLARDTYLTYPEKYLFLSDIVQAKKFPWHYWLSYRLFLNRNNIKSDLDQLRNKIDVYNDQFVNRRLIEHSTFFSGTHDNLRYPLDIIYSSNS
ncbi:MAG: hypothetical protein ACW967_00455 [Candidatus Hodarchaeales archaeon]|jgi:hypothetical protein